MRIVAPALSSLASLSLLIALSSCAHLRASARGPSPEPPSKNTPQPELEPDPEPHGTEPGEDYPKPSLCFPGVPTIEPADVGPPKDNGFEYVEELPEAIQKVPPFYPPSARGRDGDREVKVQALVRRDGTVGEVCIVRSIPALDTAAAMCVKQWRFKPAKTAGNAVVVWVGLTVRFEAP